MTQLAPQQTKVLLPQQEQRKASDPAKSVWVAASAGSGKTKVLADRVLRLLLDGVLPQRILCLTFTRAASAQMSIRITSELAEWATCDDNVLREKLDALQGMVPEPEQLANARRLFAEVLNCPGGMRIRTIHAFSQEILRRFPLEAGLPPQFKLMEESDAQALRHEALMDLFQSAASAPESAEGVALRRMVREVGEESLAALLHEATALPEYLAGALARYGDWEQLAQRQRRLLGLTSDESVERVLTEAVAESSFAGVLLRQVVDLLQGEAKTYAGRGAIMAHWLSLPPDQRVEQFDFYCGAYLKKDGEIFTKFASEKFCAAHPEIAAALENEGMRLMLVRERLASLQCIEQTAAIFTLARALNALYEERKQAQGTLDYDDLLLAAERLLHREGIAPWVLYKLDGGIDHILVDEAQDTSPTQWRIIATLADEFSNGASARSDRHRTLFVVGDEKQSIYSFLKADPATFAVMREHFKQRIIACDPAGYSEVPLNLSFRSAPAVLRAVDAVFAEEAVRQGVSAVPVVHGAFRRDAAGRVEVWPLVAAPEIDDKNEEWSLPTKYERAADPIADLASRVADQIEHWVKAGEQIRDRAIKPDDIMVLVRRRNAFVDHLVRALKGRGVPVTGVDRMTLPTQLAVMDLAALLQFALLPEDDLNLATVLRGPLLDVSEDQLMSIAIGREGSLWQSLEKNQKLQDRTAYLRHWLARADVATPFAMLTEILGQPCPADTISGRCAIWKRLGPDALDPIDELINAAQDFCLRHTPSLQAFLHWLTATEAVIKRELDQGGGQVRITTVHAAKGLEAPIVILPDTTSVPDKNKINKILWDTAECVPFYVPREPQNAFLGALRETFRQKQMEEYRRLLYVALTRPADRLYVCGYQTKRSDRTGQSWYTLVSNALKPLHEPALAVDPDSIVVADAELKKEKTATATRATLEIMLPSWIAARAPEEPDPPRPLVPSRPTQAEPAVLTPQDWRFARGRLIHRLLQSLPDVEPASREQAALRFVANPQHGLTSTQQKKLVAEVMALFVHPAFAPLFGPDSRAEVPIVGRHGQQLIAGQIDRLCLLPGEVWIVDYKTNRPPPEALDAVPDIYQRQLAAYKAVLSTLYPGQKVRCFLLWTHTPLLMEAPDDWLEQSHIEAVGFR